MLEPRSASIDIAAGADVEIVFGTDLLDETHDAQSRELTVRTEAAGVGRGDPFGDDGQRAASRPGRRPSAWWRRVTPPTASCSVLR